MSSPFRISPDSSSPRSSPSRSRLAESRNSRLHNSRRSDRESSAAVARNSPSRQLYEDFTRIVLDDDRSFARSLDAAVAEQEALHRQALDRALAQHEAVRESAERAREKVELQMWRAQKEQEERERQEVEAEQRMLMAEDAERERVRVAMARRTEEQRRQAEGVKREQDEARRKMEAQRQREEQEREERGRKAVREREEADRKAREEAAAREREQQLQAQKAAQPPVQQPAPPQINGTTAAALPAQTPAAPQQQSTATTPPGLVSTPAQRKAVHDRYIGLWRHLKVFRRTTEQQCKDAGFKGLGELKRSINTQVGMVNKTDKAANKLYIFGRPEYQWHERSLIDVLWAKYHVLCPQLFGVHAPEPRGGVEEEYYRRVTGLSAGFAAITLRDFSRARMRNPAPNRLWWECMARILNLPAGGTQVTHYIIVKACIADFVPRILQLFGGAGRALIGKAVKEFPGKGPKTAGGMRPAVMALDSLGETLRVRYGLSL
ncbi:hypothetical protein LTR53_014747 [Teratosphaeriaceae sp. CCFEE 6253]|nr:hypothetical protein LTR53_014747 [Teratosphaeriaceae sp. CCFEE 6253]